LPRHIVRTGLYFYPPDALVTLLRRVWRGDLNQDRACELIHRHAGECALWDVHGTLLDAIAIIDADRPAFIAELTRVLAAHPPITLSAPEVKDWPGFGNNVFIRWKDDAERMRLQQIRRDLIAAVEPFVVTERVDWEQVNQMDRLVRGAPSGPAATAFSERLHWLKKSLRTEWPTLLHAPNVPLEWYVDNLKDEADQLPVAKLPFGTAPHISVASAVRDDDRYGWSAAQVGDYIKQHLPLHPEFKPLLGSGVVHTVDAAFIVEPGAPSAAIEVTVVDRITREHRRELRQPWVRSQPIHFRRCN
jgi:hypothetical protein